MGETFFDDLARALAEPMPRRKALRLLAAGLTVAAVPGIRPRRAAAATRYCLRPGVCFCTGGGAPCGVPVPPGGFNLGCCIGDPEEARTVCCPRFPDGVHGSGCCPTGFSCGPGGNEPNCVCNGVVNSRTGECNCPQSKVCGNTCCEEHEKCEDGECVPCDDADRCGSDCCAQGSVCRNPKTSLCCVKTWKACQAGSAGVVKCCPPTDNCCFNKKTKSAKCCGPGVKCENGLCKCKKGEKRCGEDCCKKGEICSKGRCCPKGLVNCDGKCCKPQLCVASSGKKVCCPIERIATPNGVPVCCPPGTLPTPGAEAMCCPPGNPDCCDSGDVTQICAKGRVCANGKCV